MRENPYASPLVDNACDDATQSELNRGGCWRIFSIASVIVGLIPIYGHFAHVARDGQLTVLLLMLAWMMTCCSIVVCFVRGLTIRGLAKTLFWMLLSALLSIFAYFGFYGIGNAILELWA